MRIEEMLKSGSGVRRAPGMSRKEFLRLGGAGVAGAALLSTAGCGVFESGGGGGGGGGSTKTVAFNLEDAVRDLDSATTTDSVSTDILLNVMSGLYRLDVNTRPVPDMAESVDISEDQLSYTFKIRDGVKWSNGDPVTAHDFEYAWKRVLNPDTGAQYAYIITTFVKGAAEYNEGDGSADDVAVKATDDKTLEVELLAPSPFWLGLTSFFTYLPQNQKFVEQQGEDYALNKDALIFNGPYVLSDFKPTQGATMTKSDDYWNKANVPVQKAEGKIVKELDTAVNLYESGELDVQGIEGEYVEEYKDSPEYQTVTYFATFYMVGNQKEEVFQNLNIRKAIQIGYDRDALVNQILKNGSPAAPGYVPFGIAGPGKETFREYVGAVQPEFDPEKAKSLFQKGTDELGGNPTIELLAYDDSTARDIATFLQSQFQENLGAKIDIKVQPFDRKLELESQGNFQLSWQGWIADYNDPMTFMDLFESTSSFNTQKYSNPEYDKLISQAREELDQDKRMDMLRQAEIILVEDDAGTAPMYYQGQALLIKPTITRYVNQPYGGGKDISLWRIKA
ncbi:MAG TPA: peptide ABC transporter substrate-binding protein [Rubrobacter sp.]|nr:peptide ABC transporter substrate-binding protein [Rubrobacter sp.]